MEVRFHCNDLCPVLANLLRLGHRDKDLPSIELLTTFPGSPDDGLTPTEKVNMGLKKPQRR
jgi:hypothetical protein